MIFNSYIFVFALLPLCLIGYFALNHFQKYTLAKCYLIGISLWFYGYFNISYLLLIIGSILFNYGAYRFMYKINKHKSVSLIAVIFNLSLLFVFKYFDFFIGNVNAIFKTDFAFLHILLPLGISFFTFQQIAFIVDASKNEARYDLSASETAAVNSGLYSFIDYTLFVSFFPQLVAGPIVNHNELIPQLNDSSKKTINYENFSRGFFSFVLGLSKKVLIADVFALSVDYGFEIANELNTPSAIFIAVCYIIQLYFDFSGYSDMARGLALMMNFKLPINFDSPFKTTNMADFWTHWHITLSRFLTKYVYIPLGGNRKGFIRTYINIFIVFFLSGLWHGANWTFVIWGCINGIGVIFFRLIFSIFKDSSARLKQYSIYTLPMILFNFIYVTYSFIYFRAASLTEARTVINAIKSLNFKFGVFPNILAKFKTNEILFLMKCSFLDDMSFSYMLPAIIYLVAALIIMFFIKNVNELTDRFKPKLHLALLIAILFLLCTSSFDGISTFIYYNF